MAREPYTIHLKDGTRVRVTPVDGKGPNPIVVHIHEQTASGDQIEFVLYKSDVTFLLQIMQRWT